MTPVWLLTPPRLGSGTGRSAKLSGALCSNAGAHFRSLVRARVGDHVRPLGDGLDGLMALRRRSRQAFPKRSEVRLPPDADKTKLPLGAG